MSGLAYSPAGGVHGLSYAPGSTPQGLVYSPYSGTAQGGQNDPASLFAMLVGGMAGGGGGKGIGSFGGNPPMSGELSGGGAGYHPNSGALTNKDTQTSPSLLSSIAGNVGPLGSLYNLGNLASTAGTGTGLATGIGNLLHGFDWSGMAAGQGLSDLSAQAAADVAGGLGTDGAIVGAAGLGGAAAAGASLAGLTAGTDAALAATAASPSLFATLGPLLLLAP